MFDLLHKRYVDVHMYQFFASYCPGSGSLPLPLRYPFCTSPHIPPPAIHMTLSITDQIKLRKTFKQKSQEKPRNQSNTIPTQAKIAIENKKPILPYATWTALDPAPEPEPTVVGTSAGSEKVAPPVMVSVMVVVGTNDVDLVFEPLGVLVPVAVVAAGPVL